MADIKILTRLLAGIPRDVDLQQNSLIVGSLKVGAVTPTELTKAILDRLISLQNGSDVDATYHTHDGRYFTETELGATSGTSGAQLVGVKSTAVNFVPSSANVEAWLTGIDSALANAGSTLFSDSTLRIQDNSDPTKEIAFEASGIAAGNVRTITMPNANVDLADVNQAVLQDGTRSMTAALNFGGFKGVNAANPTVDSDVATKAYTDAIAQGLSVKSSVKAATNAPLPAVTAAGSQIGKTLTADVNGALSIDSVSTWVDIDNDGGSANPVDSIGTRASRVLVKNQAASIDNGIYVVKDKGSAGTPFILVRAVDTDGSPAAEVESVFVFVREGTTNAISGWTLITSSPIVDTDAIDFTQFSGAGQITAGNGLSKTGNTLDLDFNELSAVAIVASDELAFADASDSNIVKKITFANLESTLNHDNLSGYVANEHIDHSAVSIATAANSGLSGGGDITTSRNLVVDIAGTTEATSVASSDEVLVNVGGSRRKVQVKNLLKDQQTTKTFIAGEAMAANTTWAVRMAVSGETAGRVYKADYDATSSNNFYVIGVVQSSVAISAADPVEVILQGEVSQAANDVAFDSSEVGQPLHLTAAGISDAISAITYAANQASFRLGYVQTTTKIFLDGSKQLNGIA